MYKLELAITRMENFIYKIYPRLAKYPKFERYALCQSIRNEMTEITKCLSMANKVKSKLLYYLNEAEGHLESLKIFLKISVKYKYISIGFFKQLDLELSEVGKNISDVFKAQQK